MALQFHVGQRLSYDETLCTVRYVGSVDGTKGNWLGVEWDDPSRGKHHGEHQGVRYFTCKSRHPTAGSFVRPTRPRDRARTFLDALSVKYGPEDLKTQARVDAASAEAIQISGKEVEEVGFDKIRLQLANFKELRVTLLDNLRVSRPEARHSQSDSEWRLDGDDVGKVCPKVNELDLSRNLFEHVSEVMDICAQMPRLKSLKLSGNRFASIEKPLAAYVPNVPPFSYIRTLELSDCFLSWKEISNICTCLPILEDLTADGNGFEELPNTDPAAFKSLIKLSLERNDITSLSDLGSLSVLPRLQTLSLKRNAINSIMRKEGQVYRFTESVGAVDLSYNGISDFVDVSRLVGVFPGLTDLRITSNPVLASGVSHTTGRPLSFDDTFMLTVARLGKLKTLNYSSVFSKDRLNAETYYLSQIAAQLGKSSPEERSNVLKDHPRYEELSKIYGERAPQKTAIEAANTLASRLAKLSFKLSEEVWRDASVALNRPCAQSWEARIPKSFNIYSILGLVGKKIGLLPMTLELIWETNEEEPVRDDADVLAKIESSLAGGQISSDVSGKFRMREEVLRPQLRPLETWIEGDSASIRVEYAPKRGW